MIGTIEVAGIRVRCIVGILPFERIQEQDIRIDVSMELDFAEAAATGDIYATVDYAEVARTLSALVVERKYLLIETMIEECAALVLDRWHRVESVSIAVHKPAAIPQADDTRARIVRRRG